MNIATILVIARVAFALLKGSFKTAPLIGEEVQAIHAIDAKLRAGQHPTAEERAAFWGTLLKIITVLAAPDGPPAAEPNK